MTKCLEKEEDMAIATDSLTLRGGPMAKQPPLPTSPVSTTSQVGYGQLLCYCY